MQYYKITYQTGKNNEHIYPALVKGTVFRVTQNHFKDNVMVAGTEGKLNADGKEVVALSESEALALIDKYKKTFPKGKLDRLLFPEG